MYTHLEPQFLLLYTVDIARLPGTGSPQVLCSQCHRIIFVVQLPSHVQLFPTPWTAGQASLPLTISWSLPRTLHVHCIGGDIQPSHPLTFSSPSALDLSQHQGLFPGVICSHQMTKILELQHQQQSFQGIFSFYLPYN